MDSLREIHVLRIRVLIGVDPLGITPDRRHQVWNIAQQQDERGYDVCRIGHYIPPAPVVVMTRRPFTSTNILRAACIITL